MNLRRTLQLTAVGVTLAGLAAAFATDAVVAHTAEQRISRAIRCGLNPTGPVTAQLSDTFAGLDTLSGTLGTVHVTANGVRKAGTDMNIDAVLHGVTTYGATTGGTATATIPYPALRQHLGSASTFVTFGTDGTDLVLAGTLGGLGLPVNVATTVTTTGDTLTITPTSVTVLGQQLPVSALTSMPGGSGLAGSLKPYTVHLPGLPAGAQLTTAHPDQTGLALQLAIPATGHLTGVSGQGSGKSRSGASGPGCAASAKV